jgi:hypothetical protein
MFRRLRSSVPKFTDSNPFPVQALVSRWKGLGMRVALSCIVFSAGITGALPAQAQLSSPSPSPSISSPASSGGGGIGAGGSPPGGGIGTGNSVGVDVGRFPNPPGAGIGAGGTPPGLGVGGTPPGLSNNPSGVGVGLGGPPPGLSSSGGQPPGVAHGFTGAVPRGVEIGSGGNPPGAGIGSDNNPPGAGIGLGWNPHPAIAATPNFLPHQAVNVPDEPFPNVGQSPSNNFDLTGAVTTTSIRRVQVSGPDAPLPQGTASFPTFLSPLSSPYFKYGAPIPPPGTETSSGRRLRAAAQAEPQAQQAPTPPARGTSGIGAAQPAPSPDAVQPGAAPQQSNVTMLKAARPAVTERERRLEAASRALVRTICDTCLTQARR